MRYPARRPNWRAASLSTDTLAATDTSRDSVPLRAGQASPALRRSRGPIRRRLRQAGLLLAAFTPTQTLKRLVFRLGFGYRINRTARIGICYLDCERLTIGSDTQISHGTVFWGCLDVRIGSRVRIGWLNLFRGGD